MLFLDFICIVNEHVFVYTYLCLGFLRELGYKKILNSCFDLMRHRDLLVFFAK